MLMSEGEKKNNPHSILFLPHHLAFPLSPHTPMEKVHNPLSVTDWRASKQECRSVEVASLKDYLFMFKLLFSKTDHY